MMKYIELSNPIVKFWCFQNEQKDTEAQFDNDVGPVEQVLFYLCDFISLLRIFQSEPFKIAASIRKSKYGELAVLE